jgi:hypothetical protein
VGLGSSAVAGDQAGESTHEQSAHRRPAHGELIARAKHVLATLKHDPDQVVFQQIERAGAADSVSNTVDHLEDTLLIICPVLQVDPKCMLRAVILTAQQRLEWGYGPIGGVHDGATGAQPDRGSDLPDQPQRPHRATSRGRRRSTRKSSPLGRSNPAA